MEKLLSFVQRHFLRGIAAVALAGLTVQLAIFNAGGWHDRDLDLLAVLAVITEALAFVMAVCVEGAGRMHKAAACALILIGCEAFNAAGSHMAWDASQAPRLEAQRSSVQAELDASRAALLQTIADSQARIDRVPLPDQTTFSVRQAEQRTMWEAATADDRGTKARAQAQLDALPVVAAEAPPTFPEWVVWSFLAFLGFAKSLGLWAIGMSVAKNHEKESNATNVVAIDASELGRRLVAQRRDRQAS